MSNETLAGSVRYIVDPNKANVGYPPFTQKGCPIYLDGTGGSIEFESIEPGMVFMFDYSGGVFVPYDDTAGNVVGPMAIANETVPIDLEESELYVVQCIIAGNYVASKIHSYHDEQENVVPALLANGLIPIGPLTDVSGGYDGYSE